MLFIPHTLYILYSTNLKVLEVASFMEDINHESAMSGAQSILILETTKDTQMLAHLKILIIASVFEPAKIVLDLKLKGQRLL